MVLGAGIATTARATGQTFVWLFQKKLDPAFVKRRVCAEFGLLARHWSGCRSAALGAANGWREGRAEELALCRRSASADVVTSIVRSDCYRLERQLPRGIRTR